MPTHESPNPYQHRNLPPFDASPSTSSCRRISAPPPQDGAPALHFAALFGQLGLIDKLLANGPDINARDILVLMPPSFSLATSDPRRVSRIRRNHRHLLAPAT
jgi:ankyrin repeat protein